ncbi:MAG: TAXI family TRAP transporter solute-binding subunit [Alphaproteobacteria bacterium]|nr:TAXI family TRAP transporter solute-binding subunit [Alphaproteobacteria bacterium]
MWRRREVTLALAALALGRGVRKAAGQSGNALTLAAAGAGSAFLAFGKAIAPALQRHARIDLTIRETKGSNENVELVSTGQVALAALNMGPGFDAWNGRGPFAGRPLRGMRALVPMYETPFHTIALRASGIAKLADLAGRRVGVGPAGGPGEVFFKGIADALGIRATLATGSPAEMGQKVLAREIDAFWWGSGLPSEPFAEVTQTAEAVVFGFTADEAQAFRRLFPYFAPFEIPAGTYRGQAAPLRSMAVWNFVVGHDAVPVDTAYALTAALLGHADEVAAAYPPARSMRANNAGANTFMPFHPGAVRYYREAGVALRAELIRE